MKALLSRGGAALNAAPWRYSVDCCPAMGTALMLSAMEGDNRRRTVIATTSSRDHRVLFYFELVLFIGTSSFFDLFL